MGNFFIISIILFRPRIEEASWVVYFLHHFFLFMSFSFYEQWVNTAHVNDILTQRAMNNASEFTFMPESDPSRHPFPPSPSRLHLLPSSILTIHPHQSSASSLPSSSHPSLALFFLPPTPPSNRKQHRVRLLFTSSRYRRLLSGSGQTLADTFA